MKNINILLTFLVVSLITGCSSSNTREDFLKKVYDSTETPYKDCVTNYVRNHWDEVWKTYDKEKKREPRGETDVLNDITYKYTKFCRLNDTQVH